MKILVLSTGLPLLLFLVPSMGAAENRITHGPILGRPGATSMGVWARTFRPGSFRVIYRARSEKHYRITDPVPTALERDNTGWTLLDHLTPDTRYDYAVVVGNEQPIPGHTGSFRTLPDSDPNRTAGRNPRGLFNFSFEIGCGNLLSARRSADPGMGLFDVALDRFGEALHFAIQTGDFIYEDNDARRCRPEQWIAEMGLTAADIPDMVRATPRVVGVWENYKRYLEKSPALSRWLRNVPGLFMLDDHEILNDVAGTGAIGYRHRAACFRDVGIKGWEDYIGWANPVGFSQGIRFGRALLREGSPELVDKAADFSTLDLDQAASLIVHWGREDDGVLNPLLDSDGDSGNPNAGVYGIDAVLDANRLRIHPPARSDGIAAYGIGRRNYFHFRLANTEFFFIDTRSHRGLPVPGFRKVAGQTMLGEQQKQWLKTAMNDSEADILFVVSSVNFMIPHVGKGGFIEAGGPGDEAWTGFMAEREELIGFWETLKKPVLVFSGDLHNSFSIRITDRIWEFGAAPHNSANHDLSSEGSRPINGQYTSGDRDCRIRWSTFFLDDTLPSTRKQPIFTVVRVNNVFNNPTGRGAPSWVAYPHPQITVSFYDGFSGHLLYAESIVLGL